MGSSMIVVFIRVPLGGSWRVTMMSSFSGNGEESVSKIGLSNRSHRVDDLVSDCRMPDGHFWSMRAPRERDSVE